jgi:hypothetical protein
MTSEIARIQLELIADVCELDRAGVLRPVEAFRAADPGSCDVDHASTLLPPTGGDRR